MDLDQICKPGNSIEKDHLVDGDGKTIRARWSAPVDPPSGFSDARVQITWEKRGRNSEIDARLYLHRPGVVDCSGIGSRFQLPTARRNRAVEAVKERAESALLDAWKQAKAEE